VTIQKDATSATTMPIITSEQMDVIVGVLEEIAHLGDFLLALGGQESPLSKVDLQVLALVRNHPKISTSQLADLIHVPALSLSKSFDRLEEAGHILRTRDDADRRRILVEAQSRRTSRRMPHFEVYMQVTQEMTEEERAVMVSVVTKTLKLIRAKVAEQEQTILATLPPQRCKPANADTAGS
jgi:DNA-binding MarR family transcriptional regulator